MSVSGAQELARLIASRSAEIEEARRLPADLAAALAREGLFRMAVPRSLGGGERPATAIVHAIETLAEADASVGWCVMIGATTAMTLAWLPPATAAALFADPDMIMGGVFAPMGRAVRDGDGWRVDLRTAADFGQPQGPDH